MTFVPEILDGSPSLADRATQPRLFYVHLVLMNGVCGAHASLFGTGRDGTGRDGQPVPLSTSRCLECQSSHITIEQQPMTEQVWVLIPLLLLWESGAHVIHACSVAKTEHQPKRDRVPMLPPALWFHVIAGKLGARSILKKEMKRSLYVFWDGKTDGRIVLVPAAPPILSPPIATHSHPGALRRAGAAHHLRRRRPPTSSYLLARFGSD